MPRFDSDPDCPGRSVGNVEVERLSVEIAQLNQIIRNVPAFVGVLDNDHRVIRYNFTEEDGVVLREGQIIGKHAVDLHWWDGQPEVAQQFDDAVGLALNGKTIELELPNTHADGRSSVSRIRFQPLRVPDGEFPQALVTGIDMTAEVSDRTYREMLLKEVNHRVKNSLQIVSSILNLEASRTSIVEARDGFIRAAARVTAVSKVHDLIFRIDSFETVPFKPYLEDLCMEFEKTIEGDGKSIRIDRKSEEISISADRAINLALITNELLTNAVKYAFVDNAEGTVGIEFSRTKGQLCLTVTDNGNGVAEEVAVQSGRSTGLGTRMLEVLARQIGGEIKRNCKECGYSVSIRFDER